MKHIYSSIDIGSDSIKIVVCELYNNKINLLATTSTKSKGIKKGLITDVAEAKESIISAFNDIESMLGVKIKKVIASVPSYYASYDLVRGTTKINNEEHTVTDTDISNVLHDAATSKSDSNKETVAVLPIDFKLDEKIVTNNLLNQPCEKMDVRAIMVNTPKKNIYSVLSILESIGIEVVDISINSIGDIYTYKNKDVDRQLGAIINIGGETTTVSIYNKGIVVKSSIIGMGGANIDRDISYMYKIPVESANKIKEKFAIANKRYASTTDMYEALTNYNEVIRINQFEVSEIVMRRVEEILNLAKNEINILTNKDLEYIIVTGGTSNLEGFVYILDEVFNKQAKIGTIKLMGIRDNRYSSALGNILYFINKIKLKGKNYTMMQQTDIETMSTAKKNIVSNESMLGKIFGYFFGE